ncbi:MAG: 2,4'-dihydroxyacetophenone dioxygenase family protein [Halioglobus sp.]|nr:2,4'-dihydroxyacetophenone dioxygenase family protein [Halioglobus sp.]
MTATNKTSQLGKPTGHEIKKTKQLRSAFFDADSLEWTPWVMPDTWFKLLGINTVTGGFSMILKVAPNNVAPIHGHIGSVEGIILEGGFAYDDDWGYAGYYVNEPAGINHKPVTGKDGLVMFAVIHGPLVGYNNDGSVALVLDARAMYQLAEAAGFASHIDKPIHWTQ